MFRCLLRPVLTLMVALSLPVIADAQSPSIPNYWDEKERLPTLDLSGVERVRFLTTIDFPPFSFLDPEGRLTGFHIELARAVCRELDIVSRCQIQALPWGELDAAMETGQGEALIAGTAVTAESRERYAFSRPYLRFPARFVMRKTTTVMVPVHVAIADKRVGVLAGSAHEAMLRAYFPQARAVPFSRTDWLHDALRDSKIDGVFGDGMRLSFWIAGTGSQDCCRFVGGPYIAPEFLGAGLAIAVRPDRTDLVHAFDQALRDISVNGTFAELYLKYFPISFY